MAKKKQPTPSKKSPTASRVRRLSYVKKRQALKRQVRMQQLPSSWQILKNSLNQLWQNKRLFIGILLVYTLFSALFVRDIRDNFQLGILKDELLSNFGEELGQVGTGISLYAVLLRNAATVPTEVAGAYQTFLFIISSLALIWGLRHTYAQKVRLRIRDAFYKGMTPIIPFSIVIFFICLQLIPLMLTFTVFSQVQATGVALSGIEQILWLGVLLIGVGITFYFITSSLLGLYIVTLPGGQPRASMRAAKKLVRLRRWLIVRRLLFLPVFLLLISALVLIPLIIFLAPLAEILFFIFNILVIAIFHSYFYNLYRSLI